jgi:hypothetical protein
MKTVAYKLRPDVRARGKSVAMVRIVSISNHLLPLKFDLFSELGLIYGIEVSRKTCTFFYKAGYPSAPADIVPVRGLCLGAEKLEPAWISRKKPI